MARNTSRRSNRNVRRHRKVKQSIVTQATYPAFSVGQVVMPAGAPVSLHGVYAKYIGRVGALAVALGVGAAIATGSGVGIVRADDTGTGDNPSAEGPSEPSSPAPGDPTSEPAAPVSGSDGTTGGDVAGGEAPTGGMNVGSSGGQDTSTNDEGQSTDNTTGEEASGEDGAVEGGGETTTDTVTPPAAPAPESTPAPAPAPTGVSSNTKTAATATPPAAPVRAAVTVVTTVTQTLHQAVTAATPTAAAPTRTASARVASAAPVETGAATTALAAADEPSEPSTAVVQAAQLVVNVLSPLLSPSPTSPTAPSFMWAVLAWARREVDPTAAPLTAAPEVMALTTTSQTVDEDAAGAQMALMSAPSDEMSLMALPPGSELELANGGAASTSSPAGVVLNADGTRAYVTNSATGTVSVIDTTTNATLGSPIAVGTNPTAVVLNSTGTRLYVANSGSNNVSIIDTTNNTVIKTITVGTNPQHLALSPDGTRLLVSNAGSGNVTKINTVNNTIAVTGIKAGTNPGGIAFSPDGTYAYVANTGSDTVSIIRMSTNQVTTLSGVGDNPTNIVVNPNTGLGYITTGDGTVRVLDTTTNTIVGSITTGHNATAAALSPDGTILVTANTDDTVTAIDTTDGTVFTTLPIDSTPAAGTPSIAYGPNGVVYVTDTADNALRKVLVNIVTTPNTAPEAGTHVIGVPDPADGTVLGTVVATDDDNDTLTYTLTDAGGATVTVDQNTGAFTYTPTVGQRLAAADTPGATGTFIVTVSDGRAPIDVAVTVPISGLELGDAVSTAVPAGPAPEGLVLSADGSKAYVTNRTAGTVTVIDTATGTIVGSPITVGSQPSGMTLNADGSRLYVANRGSNSVTVINTADNSIVKTITNVGTNPEHLAISPDGTRLWVSNDGGTVTKIATATNQVVITGIVVGANPGGIAFSPDGKYAYVAGTGSDTVTAINTSTNVRTVISGVGDGPTNIVVNPATNRAYVTTLDGKVTVLNTTTNTVIGSITTGHNATAAALSPDGNVLITANTDDTVTSIDVHTGQVITTTVIDDDPEPGTPAIAYHPSGEVIFVTDGPDNVLRRITFELSNLPPVAADDNPVVAEGATQIITVLANDTDTVGAPIDPTTVVIMVNPTHGTATVNANGTVTYTSDGTEFTSDSFQYTVEDTFGLVSNTATVNITITPVNDAPVAGADTYTATEDVAFNSATAMAPSLLANDSDVDGPALSTLAETKATAKGGTVTIGTDGTFTYTSAANYNNSVDGPDSFTYTVTDGTLTAVGTATVNVTAVNDAPVAGADTYTAVEDVATNSAATMQPSLLANDSDVDGPALSTIAETKATAKGGTVTIGTDGTFTYTSAANYNNSVDGPDSFTYTVTDGTLTAVGTATVNVTAVNDAPVAIPDTYTAVEDVATNSAATMQPSLLANDTDVDGPALSTLAETKATAKGGTVVINSDGTFTYTSAANYNNSVDGPDSFTYTVTDGTLTAVGTATVNVTAVNDAPVAIPDTYTAVEDVATNSAATMQPSLLANDTDVDGPALSTLAETKATAKGGTVVINTDGTFTYQSAPDYNNSVDGPDSFTYTVTDGTNNTVGTATVNVTAVNDAPVAIPDTYTALEDVATNSAATMQPSLLANDTDVDGPALSALAETKATAKGGTVTINADGTFTYQSALNYNNSVDGPDSFTYTVTDGTNNTVGTATVNVTAVNDAPVANPDTYTALEDVATNSAATMQPSLLANDTDVDGPALSALAETKATAKGGTVTINADGTFTYTSAANYNNSVDGPDSFTYTVTDGTLTAVGTATVNVTAVNDAPVAGADTYTAAEDVPLSAGGVMQQPNLLANDSDVDGPALSTVAETKATAKGGTVTIGTDGTFTYTSAANYNNSVDGPDSFTYTVTDGTLTAVGTATVNVTAVNDAPVAGADTYTAVEDVATNSAATMQPSLLANDTDVDGPALSTLAETKATAKGGTVVINTDGTFTYQSAPDYNNSVDGPDSFTYTVTDGTLTAVGTATVNVTAVNDAPVAIPDTYTAVEDVATNSAATMQPSLLANDTDVDGPALSTVAETKATAKGGTVTIGTDGTFTYQSAPDYNNSVDGPDSFTYTVTDGTLTAVGTATVNVTAVNDAPVAGADTYTAAEDVATNSAATMQPSLLANDSDVDGPALTTVAETKATAKGGTVTIGTDGTFTYTSAANYNNSVDGPDSFTYTVTDGTLTAVGTATVNVTAVDDPVVAIDDTFTTVEETAIIAGDVLINDRAANVDGPGEFITVNSGTFTTTNGGTVQIFNGGEFNYTPATNFVGTDTFTYTVVDGDLTSSDIGTVTINVTNDNADDHEIGAVINVGGGAPNDVAISPTGHMTYVANPDGTVSAINTATNTVVGTINTLPANQIPQAVAASTTNNRLYVATADSSTGAGQLWVYNATTLAQIDANGAAAGNSIAVGNNPTDIAVTATRVYVASNPAGAGNGSVSVLNVNTGTDTYTPLASTLTAGISDPIALAIGTNNGGRLYVLNDGNDTMTAYSTGGNQANVPGAAGSSAIAGGSPTGIAIDNATTRAFITYNSAGSDGIEVFNLDAALAIGDKAITLPVASGSDPTAVAVKGSRFYVTMGNGSVRVFNTSDYSSVDTDPIASGVNHIILPLGVTPLDVLINAAGTKAYVTGSDGKIYVINIIPAI